MKKIIKFSTPYFSTQEIKEVVKTLQSNWLTEGRNVKRLEDRFKKYLGVKYTKVLNSCTSALEVSLKFLHLCVNKKPDVITTPFTFCATINPIIHVNKRPAFVDIEKDTFNISPVEIEKNITKKTAAIVVMHYGGLPADMDRIKRLAKKNNLVVIEDAAHAIGAEYKDRKIGSIGDITCFSFHATKNITTGEGGALTTDHYEVYRFIKKVYYHGIDKPAWLRNKGSDYKYRVVYPGYKYNMSDILAAIGLVQIEKLDRFIAARKRIAACYDSYFKGSGFFSIQKRKSYVKHAHHLYPVLLNLQRLRITRDRFIYEMKKRGVYCSLHFIPIYRHPAYKKYFYLNRIANDFRNTEFVYKRIVSLPIYPSLSKKDVFYIISVIDDIVKKFKR